MQGKNYLDGDRGPRISFKLGFRWQALEGSSQERLLMEKAENVLEESKTQNIKQKLRDKSEKHRYNPTQSLGQKDVRISSCEEFTSWCA